MLDAILPSSAALLAAAPAPAPAPPSSISFANIRVIDVVCTVVALLVTIVRLTLRMRSARVWWDDGFAFLSAICLILTFTAVWMHYGAPDAYSQTTRLAAYYLIALGFYVTLWLGRLSILFSIMRIVPDKMQRRFLSGSAIAFGCVLAFLCAQVFWVCEVPSNRAWKTKANPQCSLGLQVAVCQLVTDIISDAMLIFVPLRLFSHSSLSSALKIRLIIIFSATILVTVVSLVHASYLLEVKGVNAIVSAVVEISVSLLVCNLVVVVPALTRAMGIQSDAGDESTEHDSRAVPLSSFKFAHGTQPTSLSGTETGTGTGAGGGTRLSFLFARGKRSTQGASSAGTTGGGTHVFSVHPVPHPVEEDETLERSASGAEYDAKLKAGDGAFGRAM